MRCIYMFWGVVRGDSKFNMLLLWFVNNISFIVCIRNVIIFLYVC